MERELDRTLPVKKRDEKREEDVTAAYILEFLSAPIRHTSSCDEAEASRAKGLM